LCNAKGRKNNFEIKIWTYGFFDVHCKIFLKGGRIEEVSGYLNFKVSDTERAVNHR